MPSFQAHFAMTLFRLQKSLLLLHPDNTQFMRRLFEGGTRLAPSPPLLDVQQETMGSVQVEILENQRDDRIGGRVLFYIHGGGFVIGSPRSYRSFAGSLGQRAGAAQVWLPDYRRAPEAPFPAALDDVLAVWEQLHARHPDAEIVLGGDSAGGNLSVALCVAARDRGLPLPRRVYLQSPWLDLTLSSRSHARRDSLDPFLGTRFLERDFARHYASTTPRDHPLMSPLYADLRGLPPFLIQVGSREVLLDDSRHFVTRARAAGVDVTLEVWRGLWHAWPQVPFVPESLAARRKAGDWLR
ncbi:MAG: alpha/beta hydrolase [Gammaproteobacteria bacterium]